VSLVLPASAGVWLDNFDGSTLGDGWEYIDPDAANEFEVKDGSFVVHFEGTHDIWGGFDYAPKLLREAPEGDFAIESHYVIQPDAVGGLANTWTGIIVFDDTDNPSTDWLYVARGGGSVMTFEYVADGGGHSATTHSTEALDVWARIEKTGDTYLCRYKLAEGDDWTDLGEYTPASMNPLKVGLVIKSWAARSMVLSFDYFKMEGEKVRSNTTKASNPSPADGAADVARDVTLSWAPFDFAVQHDVYLGTVREDVNAASRANPLGVLVSQGQTATTYDPTGLIAFGQTYYWRVDEVNAAPDNTIFKGDVWSFAIEPYAYPIASVTATSNGTSEENSGPERTIDGSGLNASDQHSTLPGDMWAGTTGGVEPVWIQYEFDDVYRLHELWVWNYNLAFELMFGFGIKDVTIEYSADGTEWASLGDFQFAQATAKASYVANTVVDLGGVVARYVRLTAKSGYGVSGTYGLSEVRFYYLPVQARQPEPSDGAANVAVDAVLSWRGGREAATHEVYFGTDSAALPLVGSVSKSTFAPETLNYDMTYYWKVVEVNEAETPSVWEGDLWSFATQEYFVVDDFESYNDDLDAGTTIFDTWMDGWTNDTGSTVGYLDAPFAERSIVRSGRQSMPLFYDNTAVATSEAERTFASPQNWTANGIKSLSLWFRGASGNTGQLYVKINGTKVVYDGDAGDIAAIGWLPWNIDLSTIGVNPSLVTVLAVGVEGTGSGVVYIDDIRLYARTPQYGTPVEPDPASLVAYYALDGNAKDSSGNGYHGQESGSPTYEAGVNGQALALDGINDFIDLGKPSDWPAGRSPRSLCLWVMTSSIAEGYRAPVAYGTPSTSQGMSFTQNGTTLYGAGYGDDLVVPNFWEIDVWYHICLTYDGTTARLYGNGIELASGEKTWNLVLDRAHIGQQVNDLLEFWLGKVDEVRLYDRTLTAEEVAWLAGRTMPVHEAFE